MTKSRSSHTVCYICVEYLEQWNQCKKSMLSDIPKVWCEHTHKNQRTITYAHAKCNAIMLETNRTFPCQIFHLQCNPLAIVCLNLCHNTLEIVMSDAESANLKYNSPCLCYLGNKTDCSSVEHRWLLNTEQQWNPIVKCGSRKLTFHVWAHSILNHYFI